MSKPAVVNHVGLAERVGLAVRFGNVELDPRLGVVGQRVDHRGQAEVRPPIGDVDEAARRAIGHHQDLDAHRWRNEGQVEVTPVDRVETCAIEIKIVEKVLAVQHVALPMKQIGSLGSGLATRHPQNDTVHALGREREGRPLGALQPRRRRALRGDPMRERPLDALDASEGGVRVNRLEVLDIDAVAADARIGRYSVDVENFESIHAHSAYARIERAFGGPSRIERS